MSPLTGLLLVSVMGLTFAGVYEHPEQPWLESQNALSYMQQDDGDMEPDDNARSYMQQDEGDMQQDDGYMQQDDGDMQQDDGDMQQDDNARTYMEQDDVNNEIPEEGDDDFAEVETHYQNNWDGDLHFECPSYGAINKFQSIHSNKKEDRLWRFDCRYVGRASTCRWYYGINRYDRPMHFTCPRNYYLTGVRSRHHNRKEDRVWDAKCCRRSGYCTRSCRTTGYLNNWDRPLYYKSSGIFTGLISYHNNKKEDRRWRVNECGLSRCYSRWTYRPRTY